MSRVLVVLAHPDDETFACGGRIALWTQAGVPVTYVCATLGQMGRHMGRPPKAHRESLPFLRQQELQEACRILGIGDLRLLGLFDKTVEFEDRHQLAARLYHIVLDVGPSVVVTTHPRYGGHPDHDAIGAATLLALSHLPPEGRPKVQAAVHPRLVERLAQEGVALQRVDITSVAAIKRAALKAHASQTDGILRRLDQHPNDPMAFLLREECYVELDVG